MRLELRWAVNKAHDEQYVRDVVLIAESKEESKMLDDAFGEAVGEDGVIDRAQREVTCKLADGYGEHYVNINVAPPSTTTRQK